MPIKKAAFKALRQAKKKRIKNLSAKQALKSSIKRARQAVEKESPEKVLEVLKQATKVIDKSAQKHIIDKNKASRLKSRLTRFAQSKKKK